jgi:hypothetical protein
MSSQQAIVLVRRMGFELGGASLGPHTMLGLDDAQLQD